jgi:hypothetical protein
MRVFYMGNWTELEASRDYLIAPNGVVALAIPEGQAFDWAAALPAFFSQPADFSPTRLAVMPIWNANYSELELRALGFVPGSTSAEAKLELHFEYDDAIDYEAGDEEEADNQQVAHKTKSSLEEFELALGTTNAETYHTFRYQGLEGLQYVTYKFSAYDPRVKQWVTRDGLLVAGDTGTTAVSQANMTYDSYYRTPITGQSPEAAR